MMEEDEAKKILSNISTPEPDGEFVDSLFEKLDAKAVTIKAKQSRKQGGAILFPWQLSLGLASFAFIAIFGLVLILSPTTMQNLRGYLKQDADAVFVDEIEFTLENIPSGAEMFIFDADDDDAPPLDIKILKSDSEAVFGLKPGVYRVVVVENEEVIYEKVHVIRLDSVPIVVSI